MFTRGVRESIKRQNRLISVTIRLHSKKDVKDQRTSETRTGWAPYLFQSPQVFTSFFFACNQEVMVGNLLAAPTRPLMVLLMVLQMVLYL